MNAHTPITSDATATLLAEAHRIIAGHEPGYEQEPYFTFEDWRGAADYAVDGDTTELEWMFRRQKVFDLWCRCSESERTYWNDDFLEWSDRVGEKWLANIERANERRAA